MRTVHRLDPADTIARSIGRGNHYDIPTLEDAGGTPITMLVADTTAASEQDGGAQ